jgi:hypothetical protein
MSAKVMLRAAAVVMLLLAAGHTRGSPWTPAMEGQGLAVVQAMKDGHFDVMGLDRSYFDFYLGFGWMLSAILIAHSILFWQLASLSTQLGKKLRPIILVLSIESFCLTFLGWKFLFFIPVAMNGIVAICLAISMLLLSAGAAAVPGPKGASA